jgi:hypothetical protein
MSLEDDERARRLLRAVRDEPAPPPMTSAADVIRLGRRRVFAQRSAAIAGVVFVVVAIGAASIWLGSPAADDGPGVRVGDGPTPHRSAPALTGWTRVEAPPATTTATSEPPAPPSASTPPETPQPCTSDVGVVAPADTAIRLRQEVQPAFTKAVAAQLGDAPTVATAQWDEPSPNTGTSRGYVEVSVPGPDGTGSVQLEVVPFGGSPTEAADADVYAYGGCTPPRRLVQPDGSVLQLYDVSQADAARPTQRVRVYQPDGQLYVITAAGWSSAVANDDGVIIGTGELPLTEEQLADVGVRMAALQ